MPLPMVRARCTVDEVMVLDAGPEVPVSMGTDAHDSGFFALVSAGLTLFVEEVDSVPRETIKLEWVGDQRQ